MDGSQMSNDIWLYGRFGLFSLAAGWMPFLVLTLDTADHLFALVIRLGFYLHHTEVADQDPAIGRQ